MTYEQKFWNESSSRFRRTQSNLLSIAVPLLPPAYRRNPEKDRHRALGASALSAIVGPFNDLPHASLCLDFRM